MVLGVKSIPTNPNSSCQKVLINRLSLSLTMVLGNLCGLKTSPKNISTTYVTLKCVAMEKKCANLVNLSTATKIQSFPCALDNLVMKSMEILSHLCFGIGKGCSSPARWACSSLFSWKVVHSLMCLTTSSLRPLHENHSLTYLYVLTMPWCPTISES
jgi:hypothetical protein